jgi:hypothetical protein
MREYLSLTIPGNQTINPPSGIPSGGLDKVTTIFKNSYTLLLIITIALSLIFIVLGGMQWITSGGDKTKLEAARKKITWAVGGLVVAFLSFFIVSLLGFLFGVDLLSFGA